MNRKILCALLVLLVWFNLSFVHADYEELDCASDVVFDANSCHQCFNGGKKTQGDYIGLLKDDWINATDAKRILYKEEQIMPTLVSLDSDNVSWSQTPSADGFWEYSDEFDALYSEDEEWYILDPGKRVTWLQSKTWYAYKLDQNAAVENANIGLLVYSISTHAILDDGIPSIDDDEHRECVLFKSAGASELTPIPAAPVEPQSLPDTGPVQYILVFILSLLLGFGFLTMKRA